MSVLQLSLNEARHLHLAAQGLLKSPGVALARMTSFPPSSRCRCCKSIPSTWWPAAPTVLFSRLGSYPQHWLDESLRSGELMEYWAHEACFRRAAISPLCATEC